MTSFRRKIEGVMTEGEPGDPAFSSLLEWILYVGSKIYEVAVRVRVRLYEKGLLASRRLPCKVVSIGNLTVGGTGKTPMVQYVAGLLKELKQEVAVISRGYGGTAQKAGGIVSDGRETFMNVEESGDEPQLLSARLKGAPLLVGRDRYRMGRRAVEKFGSTILVSDDGFQHLALKKDLNLLLLDSVRPFGNGHCLPRGVLREPLDQMKRAHAFILTRWKKGEETARSWQVLSSHAGKRPVFRCNHVPDGIFSPGRRKAAGLDVLRDKRVFLFSGIVRKYSFYESVSGLGGRIVGSMAFSDHHRYCRRDLAVIWDAAKRLNAESIVTTEKDVVNLPPEIPSKPELLVLSISISFGEDTAAFTDYVKKWVSSFSRDL